ncbi:unnamed protein product [Coffea canephora]|uniref:malate dehydrogenase n=1 Tax=Coffea canephora TaxID=49390 RepID=A0A068U8H7_COFCA|nr:unnamed protein product [Coffea canephora]
MLYTINLGFPFNLEIVAAATHLALHFSFYGVLFDWYTYALIVDINHIDTKAALHGFVKKELLEDALTHMDLLIIPVGVHRKLAMTRDNLFNINPDIVRALRTNFKVLYGSYCLRGAIWGCNERHICKVMHYCSTIQLILFWCCLDLNFFFVTIVVRAIQIIVKLWNCMRVCIFQCERNIVCCELINLSLLCSSFMFIFHIAYVLISPDSSWFMWSYACTSLWSRMA